MKSKKHIWNKGKALVWYFHPFKDELHLRKKLIRWPRWEPESNIVEVYSEGLGCWLPIEQNRIKSIYELHNLD
jgi:hypothetical protein